MEPGTILAVAQLSAHLSLRLFNFASKVKSARAEIELIAKDLSAFGPTLKTLHYILDAGHKRGHIPQRAYDDSARLADDCRDIFRDIQRETGIDPSLQAPEQVGLAQRLRWVFTKKEQVALWQKRLESLKLSITVQISVMHFGQQVVDGGGFGAPLEDSDMVAAIRAWKLASDEYAALLADVGKPTLPAVPVLPLDPDYEGDRDIFAGSDDDDEPTVPRPPNRPSPAAAARTPLNKKYNAVWTLVDRLEHALKKTELMAWEQERLEENLEMGRHTRAPTKEELAMHMHRLTKRLQRFGLTPKVSRALAQHLWRGYDHYGGLRFPFHRQPTESGFDKECMSILGTEDWLQGIVGRRWANDVIDDVLWESTCVKFGLLDDPPASPAAAAGKSRKEPEHNKLWGKESRKEREHKKLWETEREEKLRRLKELERKERSRRKAHRLKLEEKGRRGRKGHEKATSSPDEGGSSTDSLFSEPPYERPPNYEQVIVATDPRTGAPAVVGVVGAAPSRRAASDSESEGDDEETEQWAQEKARELLQQWTYVRPKRATSVVDY